MSDREEKTGKNDNGKKNKGGKRNKIVAIEMIILVLLIMSAVAIFIQRDKSVKEAAKIHNQKAKKTEQTPQAERSLFLTVVILQCNREFQSERQNSPMRKSCI